MQRQRLFIFLIFFYLSFAEENGNKEETANNWRPVVLMHGLLASSEAMSHAQGWIEQDFPNIYTRNIEIGNGRLDSLFMNINLQIDAFAKIVASDPKLANGFNLICHSQGGLIGRGFIERYNQPPVFNFITWASPHNGVFGVPDLNALCPDQDCPWLDYLMDYILDGGWVSQDFQEQISFAAYWKDPFRIGDYIKYNIFLSDINNEKDQKNQTYKQHITSLNQWALFYSTDESIVVPPQSPWFYFFAEGDDTKIVPLNETKQYQEDWIGLKTLNLSQRLLFYTIPCSHKDIPRDVCKKWYDLYTKPLLNNSIN